MFDGVRKLLTRCEQKRVSPLICDHILHFNGPSGIWSSESNFGILKSFKLTNGETTDTIEMRWRISTRDIMRHRRDIVEILRRGTTERHCRDTVETLWRLPVSMALCEDVFFSKQSISTSASVHVMAVAAHSVLEFSKFTVKLSDVISNSRIHEGGLHLEIAF